MKSYNIVNGNIVTLNSSTPIAESLSIKNGKIQFINKLDKGLEKGTSVLHLLESLEKERQVNQNLKPQIIEE